MTAHPALLGLLDARAKALARQADTIHVADALDFLRLLPDGYVDIVITSPPYNIKWKSQPHHKSGMYRNGAWLNGFKDGYEAYNDSMPENQYQAWIKSVVAECLRVSKGLVWVNHKTRYRDGIGIHPLSFLTFPFWTEIVWNHGSGRAFNSRRFTPSHEFIYGFGRPHYWDNKRNVMFSVWDIPNVTNVNHPAPFCESVIMPLIESSCPRGGIVLDPFIGSGTTARAAQRLDRHYIGCDISAQYVADAQKRLSHAYTPNIFDTLGVPA